MKRNKPYMMQLLTAQYHMRLFLSESIRYKDLSGHGAESINNKNRLSLVDENQ